MVAFILSLDRGKCWAENSTGVVFGEEVAEKDLS